MVMHQSDCWETAAWDVEQSRYSTQPWRLHPHATIQQQGPEGPELLPRHVQQLLNCVETQLYAFHWYEGGPPPSFLLYQQHQQDAQRHCWDGLVAGTDGSVDERSEQMGAGYVLGDQPELMLTFHARVGGFLATTRAEAASILKLLQDVRMRKGHGVNLLVFVVNC
jgi:hypothetical protein